MKPFPMLPGPFVRAVWAALSEMRQYGRRSRQLSAAPITTRG